MTAPKHTPGPWRVEQDTTLIWGNCNPDDATSYGMGYPVAECQHSRPWRRDYPTDIEIDANARLIASAPDLLAALKTLEMEAMCLCKQLAARGLPGVPGDSVDEAILAARSAIAKAGA